MTTPQWPTSAMTPLQMFQPVIETCIAWQASHDLKVFCLLEARLLLFSVHFS